MHVRTPHLLSLLLLVTAVSVSAQLQTARPGSALAGAFTPPLSAKAGPVTAAATETGKPTGSPAVGAERSDAGFSEGEDASARRLPYGVGFERRQKRMAGRCGGWGGGGHGR